MLRLALTHRSYCAEIPGGEANERLEFLGDAVLGLVVAEHCYAVLPGVPEGDLARIRAAVVSEQALAPVAAALGVGPAVLLGRGEASSGGRAKPSILADVLEALIGATFLAGGLDRARAFVLDLLGEEIRRAASAAELGDPKNRLQELSTRMGLEPPRYRLEESGPDHARRYVAEVTVAGLATEVRAQVKGVEVHATPGNVVVTGRGTGRSKKQAEREAAVDALSRLSGDA